MVTEATHSYDNLDNILGKIQGLLAMADNSATTPEAAVNYRNAAEGMMFKYRIEAAMVGTSTEKNIFRPEPVWRTFRISKAGNVYHRQYEQLAAVALAHVDARCVREYADGWYTIEAIGYDSDLRFAELIFTAAMLAFGSKLEPKVDPELSDQQNAYVLRSAGLEGNRIAKLIWGSDEKALRVKARGLFRKEAALRGEDVDGLVGRGVSVKQFRNDYADAFVQELHSRLWRMRLSHAEDERGLVLASRKTNVEEALYRRYEWLRPKAADSENSWVSPTEDCQRCQQAQSGYCREHSYLRPSQAKVKEASYSAAGAKRGRAAARTIDLGAQQRGRAGSAERIAVNS